MDKVETAGIVLDSLILGFLSYTDIKRKKVSIMLIVILGTVNFFLWLFLRRDVVFLLTGMVPGLGAVLISFATKGKFGLGDGLILIALGILLGMGQTFCIWFVSLCIAAFAGMILIFMKKAGFKTPLPFVPFLLLGVLLCVIGGRLC